MSDISLVEIVNPEDDLLPQVFRLDFCHLPIRLSFEVAVQRAAVDVFHDQEDLLVGLERFVELREALMVYLFHNLYFPFDALPPIRLQQFEFLIYLDSDFLVEYLVQANSHDGVGTLSNPLADDVIVNVLDIAAFSAKLILLPLALASFAIAAIWLVLLHVISQRVRLRQVRLIQILLLLNDVLVDELLASAQLDLRLRLSLVCIPLFIWHCCLAMHAARVLGVCVYDASRLPRLKLPVLILNVLRCHYLRLALRVPGGELLLSLRSRLHPGGAVSPIICDAGALHAVVIRVAPVLVVGILSEVLVLSRLHRQLLSRILANLLLAFTCQVRLASGNIRCLEAGATDSAHSLPSLHLLRYLPPHSVVARGRRPLVQLNVVELDLANV